MWRTTDVQQPIVRPLKLEQLYSTKRTVEVTVIDKGHQVDGFQASTLDSLSAALKPIFRHLSRTSTVEFTGVEERRYLFGIKLRRSTTPLAGLQAALTFLAGDRC